MIRTLIALFAGAIFGYALAVHDYTDDESDGCTSCTRATLNEQLTWNDSGEWLILAKGAECE